MGHLFWWPFLGGPNSPESYSTGRAFSIPIGKSLLLFTPVVLKMAPGKNSWFGGRGSYTHSRGLIRWSRDVAGKNAPRFSEDGVSTHFLGVGNLWQQEAAVLYIRGVFI